MMQEQLLAKQWMGVVMTLTMVVNLEVDFLDRAEHRAILNIFYFS